MTRRLITATALAVTLGAGALIATPASASSNVAFGLSFNVPGASVAPQGTDSGASSGAPASAPDTATTTVPASVPASASP